MIVTNFTAAALAPLFAAIAQVESDNGATSDNVYQITEVYVDDVNRIRALGDTHTSVSHQYDYVDVCNRGYAQAMMTAYWRYYAPRTAKRLGRPVDFEMLACIHNGGPCGAERKSTEKYWRKVSAVLKRNNKQKKENSK